MDEFLERIGGQLENIRPVNAQEGTRAVFQLSRHPDRGLTVKVRDALPEDIRRKLWPENFWRRRRALSRLQPSEPLLGHIKRRRLQQRSGGKTPGAELLLPMG